MNPYETLNVNKKASKEDIKRAYRQMAKENHPDKGGIHKVFSEISRAYSILNDDKKRREYDSTGKINEHKDDKVIQGVLCEFFSITAAIPPEDLKFTDIIEKIRININTVTSKGKEQRRVGNERIKAFKDMLKRFKVKKEGRNLFQDVIENEIRTLNKKIDDIDDALELNEDILKFLDNYEYKCKEKKVEINFGGSFFAEQIQTGTGFTQV